MDTEFRELVEKAIAGDSDAIERLLLIYMPLIEHHSTIQDIYNEDCFQYLLLKVIKQISDFTE